MLKDKDAIYLLGYLVVVLLGTVTIQAPCIPYNVALGSALISAGVTGLSLFLYVHTIHREPYILRNIREFNLTQIFSARSAPIKVEYDKRLEKVTRSFHTRHHIDIMGFGLRNLREDYGGSFLRWAKKARVRILVIDPEFPDKHRSFSEQREQEEGDSPGTITRDVRALVAECSRLGLFGRDGFEIRLYRCLPSVNMFRIDNEVFWGPYFIGSVSRNMPTFLVGPGLLSGKLMDHFDAIWNTESLSRAVPEKWISSRQ